jgi:hypothetical protein
MFNPLELWWNLGAWNSSSSSSAFTLILHRVFFEHFAFRLICGPQRLAPIGFIGVVAPTLARPRGGIHHKLLMFLTWMGSFTRSCIDTRYKEPWVTVPFDGRKEPRMISPMWLGMIEPRICHLLGGCDNH